MSKCFYGAALMGLCLGCEAATVAPSERTEQSLHAADNSWVIYGDALSAPFINWSWGDHTLAQGEVVHSGSQAARLNPSNWAGLQFHAEGGLDLTMFSGIDMWVNAGNQGENTELSLMLVLTDGSKTRPLALRPYGPNATLPAWQWVRVRVPFADLRPTRLGVTDIVIQGGEGSQSDVYVDDVRLLSNRAGGWLYTAKNRIHVSDGANWHGRGANIQDTRGCGACMGVDTWQSAGEVKRRIDALADGWGANFIRLTLESEGASGVLTDPTYLQAIKNIVDHVGSKPGVYLELSVWIDPSIDGQGWPTSKTAEVWRKLAGTFAHSGHVLFGLVNEPQRNNDGAQDGQVWQAMNDTVAAIREVESLTSDLQHIILVQGTGGWSRFLKYYIKHPITAAGGANIAYEVHVYDHEDAFWSRFGEPSQTLPVVIGEYGPLDGTMGLWDCQVLQKQAKDYEVPYLAWTFHHKCPPNLIETQSSGCGIGMGLQSTEWGQLVKRDLQAPW